MNLSLHAIIAIIVAGICIIVTVAVLMAVDARNDARRAKANATLSDARTASASDASAIRDRADERNAQITDTVKEGTADVRNAPDDDSAGAAALRGLCKLYPDRDARCRMHVTPSRRVE